MAISFKILLGFVFVIFGYGALMGLWWNIQKIILNKGVNSSVIRAVSGLVAGIMLISLSFVFYGIPTGFFSIKILGSFFIAVVLNIIIAYCWFGALEKTDPAVGPQVQVFGPIITLFVGKLLLNEMPNISGVIGIFVTLFGVYAFYKESNNSSVTGPIKRIIREWKDWLVFAIIAGVSAGISVPFDKLNILHTNSMLAPGITLLVGWGLFYTVYGWLRPTRPEVVLTEKKSLVWKQETIWLLAIAGLCFGIANGFQGVAYTLIPTAVVVGTLKRIDALWSIFFVLIVFKQNTRPFRISGAIIIFIGIVIMGISNLYKDN
ncbi:MAG: DMT family transporter [Patescibacteria group bacterium]